MLFLMSNVLFVDNIHLYCYVCPFCFLATIPDNYRFQLHNCKGLLLLFVLCDSGELNILYLGYGLSFGLKER